MNGWMVACIHAWMDRCVCKRKSHHQLLDALDFGLATQALVHNVRFNIITKSSSAAGCRHLVCPAADDDFVICQNACCGQVLVLPS